MKKNPLDFDGMLDRVIADEEEFPISLVVATVIATTNSSDNVTDQTEENSNTLRDLLDRLSWKQKIAVAQIACNLIGSTEPIQLIKLQPFGEHFDDQLQKAITLMNSLEPETLSEIAIEILQEVA